MIRKSLMLLLFVLIAHSVYADGRYLWCWMNKTAPQSDRAKVKAKIKAQIFDNEEVDFRSLPEWFVAANTNKIGWLLCIDIEGRSFSFTKAEAESWTTANLTEPNKLQWVTGGSIQTVYNAGLTNSPHGTP